VEIPVLIETVQGNGYRASTGGPLSLVAEGATREEALAKLRQAIEARLSGGAQVVPLQLPGSKHPLAKYAGMYKDDPFFEEWQEAIAEYRRQKDEELGLLP
jgi:predicted RNase H-like HicB family nuclease